MLEDEALITVYILPKRTLVWALAPKGALHMTSAKLGRLELVEKTALLRDALEPDAITLDELPDLDLNTAYAIYGELFKPSHGIWSRARHLIYVSHGPLATIPLHVLPYREPTPRKDRKILFDKYRKVDWMVRKWGISQIPSAGALILLRMNTNAVRTKKPFLGFCDPIFSPDEAGMGATKEAARGSGLKSAAKRSATFKSLKLRPTFRSAKMDHAGLESLPRLPETEEEVRTIAEILKADQKDVKAQVQASEYTLNILDSSKSLADYRVVSFATHGLVAGDLDGLTQPALALSNPKLTRKDEDGLLTMREILGLSTNADWVILSACNTAAADGAGSEAVSGLGRAFFYAGARSLLVSSWPVHSGATKELMVRIFKRYDKDSSTGRSEQVRQAMVSLIADGYYKLDNGKIIFSYAHPLFWAPFFIVGEGASQRMISKKN